MRGSMMVTMIELSNFLGVLTFTNFYSYTITTKPTHNDNDKIFRR